MSISTLFHWHKGLIYDRTIANDYLVTEFLEILFLIECVPHGGNLFRGEEQKKVQHERKDADDLVSHRTVNVYALGLFDAEHNKKHLLGERCCTQSVLLWNENFSPLV